MAKRILITLVCAVVIVVCANSSYGKGSPDQIVITSNNGASIQINEREILKQFDPWSGQFIDWPSQVVSAPIDRSQSYEVFFYMKRAGRRTDYDRGELKLIYAIRYLPGHDGARGFIYLPGKGEKYYNNNIGTIWRENDDGKWHQASASWDAVIKRILIDRTKGQHNFSSTLCLAIWWAIESCCLFGV